jgi:hypothetical protein
MTAAAPISVLFLKGDQDPNNQYCGAVFPSFNVAESSSDQDFDYPESDLFVTERGGPMTPATGAEINRPRRRARQAPGPHPSAHAAALDGL